MIGLAIWDKDNLHPITIEMEAMKEVTNHGEIEIAANQLVEGLEDLQIVQPRMAPTVAMESPSKIQITA